MPAFRDNDFTVISRDDNSKKMAFDISGVSASTRRTLTTPDANGTMALLDATQTLTNKTIDGNNNTLTVLETQVSDGSLLARLAASETVTGTWTFLTTSTLFEASQTNATPVTITGAVAHVGPLLSCGDGDGIEVFKINYDGDVTFATSTGETSIFRRAAGTTGQVVTIPVATDTLAMLGLDQTWTGDNNFNPLGNGGLTSYDISIGDTDGTPTYGIARFGNSIIGRTSYNVASLDLDGCMIFRNVGAPATSNIEFLFAESANAIRFAIPKSGAGNATYNARSMLIAGPAVLDDTIVTVGYWQGTGIFDNLACDTSGDGADLGVQNDLEVEGDIFTDSIKESTTEAGVTIEGVRLEDSGMVLPEIADHPEAPASGELQLWAHSDDHNLTITDETGLDHRVGGIIHVQTSTTSVSNTTTETDIIDSTVTIPANRLEAGTIIEVLLMGEMRRSGGGTVEFVVELGGTEIVSTQPQFIGGSAHHFRLSCMITCRTTGASGTMLGEGFVIAHDSSTNITTADFDDAGATVDTTGSLTIAPRIQFATASSLNFINLTSGYIKIT